MTEREHKRELIVNYLQLLPKIEQSILFFRWVRELRFDEIALLLGLNEEETISIHVKVIEDLKECLKKA